MTRAAWLLNKFESFWIAGHFQHALLLLALTIPPDIHVPMLATLRHTKHPEVVGQRPRRSRSTKKFEAIKPLAPAK